MSKRDYVAWALLENIFGHDPEDTNKANLDHCYELADVAVDAYEAAPPDNQGPVEGQDRLARKRDELS